MPEPILWDQKIIVFDLESTYGTDATPDGADAVLSMNGALEPMLGTDVPLEYDRPYMGADPTLAAELHAKVTFEVALQGSGTAGTPPAFGKLMRACATSEVISAGTSVTYAPVTDGHESGTMYFTIGNTLHALLGARGRFKLPVMAEKVPKLVFEFLGLWVQPTEDTRPTVDTSAWKDPVLATTSNTSFTIDGDAFALRQCELDTGNAVEPRFLIGENSMRITGKSEAFTCTVQAVPVTTFDPYAAALNSEKLPIVLTHGTQAGLTAALSIPAGQMQRVQGLENVQNITEWPLRFVPQYVNGNDQWTLTFT